MPTAVRMPKLGMSMEEGRVVAWQVGKALGVSNIDWIEWGGLYMNLVASVAAIVLVTPT